MARAHQRPGYAMPGQYRCRRNDGIDPKTNKPINLCGKPVPPGELPYYASNTRRGQWLLLCADCRQEMKTANAPFLNAGDGVARLVADLHELTDHTLISERAFRVVLHVLGKREFNKAGPLPKDEIAVAKRVLDRASWRERAFFGEIDSAEDLKFVAIPPEVAEDASS